MTSPDLLLFDLPSELLFFISLKQTCVLICQRLEILISVRKEFALEIKATRTSALAAWTFANSTRSSLLACSFALNFVRTFVVSTPSPRACLKEKFNQW